MQAHNQSACLRLAKHSIVLTMISLLFLSGCTNYRSVDQGAKVPWARALAAAKAGPIDGNRYRVAKGDALGAIAARYDIRLSTLAAANNIQSPYTLYPGEVLRIPDDAPLPTTRPEIRHTALPPAKQAEPSFSWRRQSTPAPVVEGERHVVASGESLASIAARHDLTLRDLVGANRIGAPYQIVPGQVLIIPAKEIRAGETRNSAATSNSVAPAPPLSREGFMWPVYGELIGTFEQRGASGRSGGVNIAARKGTPVRASENGIVAYAGEAVSGYGQLIMLRHAKGYVTLYAHNNIVLVREGDVVSRGQTIAEVGDSGDVAESQLHFELRRGKVPVDPTEIIAGLPGRQVGSL